MLSDEEKKAIVELNHFSNMTAYWKQEEYTNSEIDNYIKIVLNLIEKQSKKIEELKEGYKIQEHNYQVAMEEIEQRWEDKIKAKIEEYEKQIEKMEKDDIGVGFTLGKEWSDLKAKVEFGQSLLEKE